MSLWVWLSSLFSNPAGRDIVRDPTPYGDIPPSVPVSRPSTKSTGGTSGGAGASGSYTPAPSSDAVKIGKTAGGALAAAVAMIAAYEGVRYEVYKDIGGVPTVCYGETANIQNRRYTATECLTMLRARVAEFNSGIRSCVKAPMRASREAALTSFAYNVGVRAACNSTAVRKINAGDAVGGCNALMMWNKVAGVAVRGLTNRRASERDKCLRNED